MRRRRALTCLMLLDYFKDNTYTTFPSDLASAVCINIIERLPAIVFGSNNVHFPMPSDDNNVIFPFRCTFNLQSCLDIGIQPVYTDYGHCYTVASPNISTGYISEPGELEFFTLNIYARYANAYLRIIKACLFRNN